MDLKKGLWLGVLAVAMATLFAAWTLLPSPIPPIKQPDPAQFSADQVTHGGMLVAAADCAVCHTTPGAPPFAGGRALDTPFGGIKSTNITPDPETGIGTWSLAAFQRAMHQGIARDGSHLYPVFPYDHFTRMTDDDVAAIYAFIMSQPATVRENDPNSLNFPFNLRILMAGWNILFLDDNRFTADPTRSDTWNRGAYLAEGAGHCGACHTPRNALGAERADQHFAGALIEGWHAPALDAASPALVPWTADALVNYFLDGWDAHHGVAAGPMTAVVDSMAALSEDDAYAIAEYVLSFQEPAGDKEATALAFAATRQFGGSVTPATGPDGLTDPMQVQGQETFTRVCANCHREGTKSVPLALTSTINGPDPANLVRVITDGIAPPTASFDRSMPAFGTSLTASETEALVAFVRAHFTERGPWTNIADRVAEARAAP